MGFRKEKTARYLSLLFSAPSKPRTCIELCANVKPCMFLKSLPSPGPVPPPRPIPPLCPLPDTSLRH